MTTYLTYYRISEKTREEHLPELDTVDLQKALAAARRMSEPAPRLRPKLFSTTVIAEGSGYPVAVFRNGEQLEDAAPESALAGDLLLRRASRPCPPAADDKPERRLPNRNAALRLVAGYLIGCLSASAADEILGSVDAVEQLTPAETRRLDWAVGEVLRRLNSLAAPSEAGQG
jgi:hypothetical protein